MIKIKDTQPIGACIRLKKINLDIDLNDGIYIPEVAKPDSEILEVIELGSGEEGVEFNVKIGDYVLVDKRNAVVMKIQNDVVIQAELDAIFARIEDIEDYESILAEDGYVIVEKLSQTARFEKGIIIPASSEETARYMIYAISENQDEDEYDIGDIVYILSGLEFELGYKTLIAVKKVDILAKID